MPKELQELGEWKVGMEALMEHGGSSLSPDEIVVVSRITDGRNGTIYIKSRNPAVTTEYAFDTHGNQRGGGAWSSAYIKPLTEEMRTKLQQQNRRSKLVHFKWKELPFEQSDKIVAFMRENGIKI